MQCFFLTDGEVTAKWLRIKVEVRVIITLKHLQECTIQQLDYELRISLVWWMARAKPESIGPLHDPVTLYKIKNTGQQVAQWDFQNNAPAFVLEVPLYNLLTSICNFIPCDRVVQRAYLNRHKKHLTLSTLRTVFTKLLIACHIYSCFSFVLLELSVKTKNLISCKY